MKEALGSVCTFPLFDFPFMWSSHCLGMIFTLNLESKNIFAFCFSLNTEGFTKETIFHQKLFSSEKYLPAPLLTLNNSWPRSTLLWLYSSWCVTQEMRKMFSRSYHEYFTKKKKQQNPKVFISQLTVQLVACMPSETATAFTSINLAPFFDDGLYICFHSASCFLPHFLSL